MITPLLAMLGILIGVILLGIGVAIGEVVKNLLEQRTMNEIRRELDLPVQKYTIKV